MTNKKERIRNMLQNEKGSGGLLLIVLFFFILIAIFSIPLFSMTVNRQSYDREIINEKRANAVAVGGMESFIKYLNSKPTGTSRQAYFNSYPGWGPKTILLPEGDKIIYNLTNSRSDDPNKYMVTMTATAGTNKTVTKSLKYIITVNDNSQIIDPTTNPTKIDKGTVYVGGSYLGNSPNPNSTIKQAIGNSIINLSNSINTQINTYASQAQPCMNYNDIINIINNSTNNPVIIEAGDLTLNGGNYNFVSPRGNQVVLIVKSLTANNDLSIKMDNGTLIVRNNINANNSFNFNSGLSSSQINNSNLWIQGSAVFNNNTNIYAGQTLYAGSITANNKATLSATSVAIRDALNLNNQLTLNASKDIECGSITANNQATINCSTGDLFVRDNLSANNQITLNTGGYIAVGGNITLKNNMNITTGGDVNSSTTGGGGGSGAPWNPTRQ